MADSFPDDDASEEEEIQTNASFISEPTGEGRNSNHVGKSRWDGYFSTLERYKIEKIGTFQKH